jgi:hypothetical protein
MINKVREQRALPPLRTANLTVWAEDFGLRAQYRNNLTLEYSRPSLKLNINLGTIGDRFLKFRYKLEEIAEAGIWSNLREPLSAPSERVHDMFTSFTELVTSEGAALYKLLISEPELGPYIRKINELPPGSSITIETDCALFPWEILYPGDFNINMPKEEKSKIKIDAAKFWGNRFLIEYVVAPRNGSSGIPPLDEHQNGRTFVSLNLNPTIDKEFRNRPYKPVKEHRNFYNAYLRKDKLGELQTDSEKIKGTLLSESLANIIYLFCHGKSDDPFDKGGGEQLDLGDNEIIDPDLFEFGDNKYLRGPIIILNSCSSGAYSPFSFSTFHSQFIKRKALGVIGTTLPMPATFASAFGQRLILDYIKGDTAIGDVLLNLRRELFQYNNPLGLFYVLQCPWHVKAPKAEIEPK